MSKKNKKIFKQKIKEMLAQTEKPLVAQSSVPMSTSQIPTAVQTAQPASQTSTQPITKSAISVASPSSIISPTLVKADLKKIAIVFLIMAAIIVVSIIISDKTNWFSILSDKIYAWAKLGS